MKELQQLHLSQQLSALLEAGLPLLDALEMLHLPQLKILLSQGEKLSLGLEKMGFHPFCLGLIQAGEATGELPESFKQVTLFLEKRIRLQQKINQALRYPMIVLTVSLLVLWAMFQWVIPSFEHMFANFQASLPWPTLILIDSSHWIQENGWVILLILTILWFSFLQIWSHHTATQQWVDQCLVLVPIFGKIRKASLLIQWSRNIALLSSRGIPLLEALKQTALYSNDWLSFEVSRQINASLSQGWTLAESIQSARYSKLLFEEKHWQLIHVGETSGDLSQMLHTIAKQEEEHLNQLVDQLTQSLEPCLMLFMGLIIACIVIALYLPIFEMGQIL